MSRPATNSSTPCVSTRPPGGSGWACRFVVVAALAFVLAACFQTGPAGAAPNPNGQWLQQDFATSPPPRDWGSMAYDPEREQIILFGGWGPSGVWLADTWALDETGWSELDLAPGPPSRIGANMAYDPGRGQIILHGGLGESGIRGDTWALGDSGWEHLDLNESPPNRYRASMAYDPGRGQIILHGGEGIETQRLGDTWALGDDGWHELELFTGPSGLWGASMAVDAEREQPILFGGHAIGGYRNDTWALGGAGWGQLDSETVPPVRNEAAMTYDPIRKQTVLFGGWNGSTALDDTWTLSENGWTQPQLGASPPGRYRPMMAYDFKQESLVLFGGVGENGRLGDTWVLTEPLNAPIATIESPADGGVFTVGEVVSTEFSCEEGDRGPGMHTCVDSNGDPAPSGRLDTTTVGTHAYTVTATSQNELTGSATISYTVKKATPKLTLGAPASAEVGESVSASGTLAAGHDPSGTITFRAYGPEDVACGLAPIFDSGPVAVNGNRSYGSPVFAFAAEGEYRWNATYSGDAANEPVETACGQAGSITTAKTANTPGPVCPPAKLGFSLKSVKAPKPTRNGSRGAGIRVKLKAGKKVTMKVQPRVRYRIRGKARVVKLKTRVIKVKNARTVRFKLPKRVSRDLRRAGLNPRKAKVTLIVKARLRLTARPGCFQRPITRKLKSRIH